MIEIDEEPDFMYVGYVKKNYDYVVKKEYDFVFLRHLYNALT